MSAETITSSFPGTVLALDTSTSTASAALSSRGSIVASVNFETTAQVSKTLFTNLQKLLDTADIGPQNVDRFAAVTGPGSFTGLRVGLSAIESMARTLKRPGVGVTAFDAVATSLGIAGRIIVLLEAGKGELFYGVRIVDPRGGVESSGNDGSGPDRSGCRFRDQELNRSTDRDNRIGCSEILRNDTCFSTRGRCRSNDNRFVTCGFSSISVGVGCSIGGQQGCQFGAGQIEGLLHQAFGCRNEGSDERDFKRNHRYC